MSQVYSTYTMLLSPLMSPYSFSTVPVEPFVSVGGHDAARESAVDLHRVATRVWPEDPRTDAPWTSCM